MQLNVLRELREPIGSVTEYDIDEREVRTGDMALEEVRGTLTLLRTDRGILARVAASGKLRERCSRCLVDVTCDVPISFEEEFLPVFDPATGARVRVPDGSDVFRIEPDCVLDLLEPIRQYIVMSGPSKPLCREACAGLCPTCGANLNPGPCSCEPVADERWKALAGLNREGNEGS